LKRKEKNYSDFLAFEKRAVTVVIWTIIKIMSYKPKRLCEQNFFGDKLKKNLEMIRSENRLDLIT
jgi:hypothetical protein